MLTGFHVSAQFSRLLFKGTPLSALARWPHVKARTVSCTRPLWQQHSGTETPLVGTTVGTTVCTEDTTAVSRQVLGQVNAQVAANSHGRLFAVVYIHGKQYKVTAEDLIVVQADMPVDIGDALRLEKVLLVGARDFTLVGRPLLAGVSVDAVVVEKTLSQQVRNFIFKRRSRFQRHYFYRFPFTVLRINAIRLPTAESSLY